MLIKENIAKEKPFNDCENGIIKKEGYQVVYDYKGYTLCAGNCMIFPERGIAQRYLDNYKQYSWADKGLYIKPVTYEGEVLQPCREYNGKRVFNADWYFGPAALYVGDLVEESIIEDMINALPPVSMRSDCMQGGGAHAHKIDEDGRTRATYATFKKIAEGIYEYCGNCFRGENEIRGKDIAYA